MNRCLKHVLEIALISGGLSLAVPARAASVQQVSRSTWGATGVPSYVNMYIYVPDTLAASPPIVVALHSCGTPVSGYVNSITGIQAAAAKNGFIIILPEATGQNCWDVGTTKSLTHDGGGDTQAIAQMVKYTLTKYQGDAARVYAMGGSSGGMMTQALMAVYPDIFKAGAARAGVPAACWSSGYDSSNQWSNNCANGTVDKTGQQWGDLVRAMDPGYTGPRRRMQLIQGDADEKISFKNMTESIQEWTNILGLSETPTSTDVYKPPTSSYTYDRKFWKNDCGYTVLESWAGRGGSHSMAYEENDILAFFGLDKAGGADPETTCSGASGGAGGMGGMSGVAGGSSTAGAGGRLGGAGAGPVAGAGGVAGVGGNIGSGGAAVTGGSGGAIGSSGAGGAPSGAGRAGVGGSASIAGGPGMPGAGGSPLNGGTGGSGTAGKSSAGSAGKAGSAGSAADTGAERDAGGCGCVIGEAKAKHSYVGALALGLVLLAFRRRGRCERH